MLPDFITVKREDKNLNIVVNEITNKYIKIGNIELEYLKILHSNNDSKSFSLSRDQKNFLYQKFKELGFLSSNDSEKILRKRKKNELSKIHIFQMNPTNLFEKNKWLYNKYFITTLIVISFLLLIIASVLIINNFNDWFKIKILSDLKVKDIIGLYSLILFTIVVHEMSHAIACYRYGGKVKEVGIIFLYFSPAFYCDVSSIYLFNKKVDKLKVLLAGVLSQITLSSVTIILIWFFVKWGFNYNILVYYVCFNIFSVISNLSPVIKLDGYWILVQLTGLTNLREKSIKYLLNLLFKKNQIRNKKITNYEKKVFFLYSLIGGGGTTLVWLFLLSTIYTSLKGILPYWIIWVIILFVTLIILIHIKNKAHKYWEDIKSETITNL